MTWSSRSQPERALVHCRTVVAGRPVRTRVLIALTLWTLIAVPVFGSGPGLREANIRVTFVDTGTCEVDAAFAVVPGTATSLEHRLQIFDGTSVELRDLAGADLVRPAYTAGRTQVLQVQPTSATEQRYTIRYRVVQPRDRAYRCPLWVPTAPSDGQSVNVHIAVVMPAGATPLGGGFPALRWAADQGVARLGHVPAFVRVPFTEAGGAGATAWNISQLMDGTAVLLLVAGTAAFIWRKRR
jgi:hypothetical protein